MRTFNIWHSITAYNVHELLKLADRFQCDLLKDRCEEHLVNGVEFPLIERLLCAEIYRLEKLKVFLTENLGKIQI